ncbi:B12-binding domain-containing radical SAM protein [Novispirillum sp. DQ9]|uniref:B12-binding domain-containing radical SAM protein n=1 Tax=Novispirillum sp. DQ9 TaxID=3398612 RepID=UPI003C7B6204
MTALKRLLLVSPMPSFTRDGQEKATPDRLIQAPVPVVRIGALVLVTVAALVPDGLFDITLCDEELERVDLDTDADIIGITANVAQAQRGIRLAREFKRRGKTVIMGGPHVSLAPWLFEGEADSIVVGELEPIATEVFTDLHAGRLKPRYTGAKADMAAAVLPRWDLYPNDRVISGVVQTSRGCPFECKFCDVIQYLGRVQRHKPVDRVIEEIGILYDLGYRHITLSDDNFTVYRRRARSLLEAIIAWNGADGRDHVTFDTQMSIDVARDPDLMNLCNHAGLRYGLFGLETSSPEGLAESNKRQNLRVDLKEECEKAVTAGIHTTCSLIVGFDTDGPDCFQRQLDFAMSLPNVIIRVAVLVASVATPLYDELRQAGRIVADAASQFDGGDMMTNFLPARMTREALAEGTIWLSREIMRPENAAIRFRRLAELLRPAPWAAEGRRTTVRPTVSKAYRHLLTLWARDPSIRALLEEVRDLAAARPLIREDLMDALGHYLAVYDGLNAERRPLAASPLATA